MVSLQEVESQLKKLGLSFRWWGRSEIKELGKVLSEGETIKQCLNGHYQGGFALLAATNQRLLLIDRKPMFLTIEAIWYDKIGQVDFNHRLLNATICISTPNKDLNFTSWNNTSLKHIMLYTQERMNESKSEDNQRHEQSQADNRPIESRTDNQAYSSSMPVVTAQSPAVESPHLNIPRTSPLPKTPYEATLYAATRLPFSRRRYYAR